MEAAIQSKVVRFARENRVIARKLSFGEGWPDYLFLYSGTVLFIEFKSPGAKPEPLQRHIIGLLRAAGFQVEVVDNVVNGKAIIRRFIDADSN